MEWTHILCFDFLCHNLFNFCTPHIISLKLNLNDLKVDISFFKQKPNLLLIEKEKIYPNPQLLSTHHSLDLPLVIDMEDHDRENQNREYIEMRF